MSAAIFCAPRQDAIVHRVPVIVPSLAQRRLPGRRPAVESFADLLLDAMPVSNTTGSMSASGSNVDDQELFLNALSHYRQDRWETAFGELSELADRGHAMAAKLALLMLRHEVTLFETSFVATPRQVAKWAQCVLRASSRATARPRSMTAIA